MLGTPSLPAINEIARPRSALKADQIVRKLRLLALTTLASKSATKEITYAEIANALKLDEDDIEISVIDGAFERSVVVVADGAFLTLTTGIRLQPFTPAF